MHDPSTYQELPEDNAVLKRKIMELEQSEKALKESASRLNSISNNLPSAMIYQLVEQVDGTRKFTYLSDTVKQLHGISPEEAMADPARIYNSVHKDDIALLMKAEDEALKTLSTFRVDVRMNDLSGKRRWSSFASTPTLMKDGSVCWDGIEVVITERKLMDERLMALNRELEKTNKDLQTAYQFMRARRDALKQRRYKEGIGFMVDRAGRIEWLTETVLTFINKSRTALIGSNILDLLQTDCHAEFLNALKQAWIGTVYPLSVRMALNEEARSIMEVSIMRVSSLDMRRLWVMLDYPTEILGAKP